MILVRIAVWWHCLVHAFPSLFRGGPWHCAGTAFNSRDEITAVFCTCGRVFWSKDGR
jgi:hypothetical protein